MSPNSTLRNCLPVLLFAMPIGMTASISAAAEEHAHWSYSGETGPAKWGGLEHDFSSCALGKHQSPIDIRDVDAHAAHLSPIDFAYKPSSLRMIDNGHTIQVNYAPGSSITVGGEKYELVQFHFHEPSEEKINGKTYAMVAHLVHKNAKGKLAVVAVLLDRGQASPLVDTLWSHLPKEQNKEVVADSVSINIENLLPKDRAYYTFTGSLTTPPCSEDVTWFVLKHATTVSQAEIDRFGKVYPMNARPVQPLNDREIQTSD